MKVLIPYVIWSIAYILLNHRKNTMVLDLLTGSSSVQMYYVIVYIELVLITPFVIWLLSSKLSWIGYVIMPVSILFIRYILPFMGLNLDFYPFPGTNFLVWIGYYYMGLALRNGKISIHIPMSFSIALCAFSFVISVAEGYAWYCFGNNDMASTQIRLSSVLLNVCLLLFAYQYIINDSFHNPESKFGEFIVLIGDYSFGIYLSHIAVRTILEKLPFYSYLLFPIRSICVLLITLGCVVAAKKVLRKKISPYLGL